MPATPVWLAGIEGLLNRNIAAATQGERLARRLNGRSLQVDALGLFRLRATTVGLRLILQPGDDTPADAVISGSPPALLKMLTGASAGPAGQDSVQVRGDAEVAAFYRELLTLARPDWEEELSRLVGDLPARRVGRLSRQAFAWLGVAGRRMGENLAEYWQYESRDLVNKVELEEYLSGVDAVREAGDRLEARIKNLERRLRGGA
jgi:ubiquinone biosynthesis protein UbiJ